MPQIKAEKIYFSHAEILEALDNFNQLYKSNKIKEKIDYQIWKKLKSCVYGINVEYCYSLSNEELLMFFEVMKDKNGNLIDEDTEFCSFDVYNSEFGTFFSNNYYDKHPNIISNTDYDSWENYKSMRDMCTSSACTSSSGNQTLDGEKIKYWDYTPNYDQAKKIYNDLSVGTAIGGKTLQPSDYTFSVDTDTVSIYGEPIVTQEYVDKSVKEAINEIVNKYNEKEKDNMKGFNFNFGPCTGDNIKMSVYGLAIQNANGEWVSYDTKSGQIMNVDLLNFDGRKFMFKMPVAIKDIAVGQLIIHNKVPMFVTAINENGTINVVDIRAGEDKNIYPQRSPFGFDFVTRVISLFDNNNIGATENNPFGNMWLFALMGDNEMDMKDMLMFSMMSGYNGANCGNINPMLMMLMADNDKSNWLLPMLMMNNNTTIMSPLGKDK